MLAFQMNDNSNLSLTFKNIYPGLKCLQIVYRACVDVLNISNVGMTRLTNNANN